MSRQRPKHKPSSSRGSTYEDPRPGRLKRLRALLKERGCDAALITGERDLRYLTGFPGEASFLLVGIRKAVLISDFRFEEDLEIARPVASIHLRSGAIAKETGELVRELGLKRVAIQEEHATVGLLAALRRAGGTKTFVPESSMLDPLRVVKSSGEVRLIRKAVRVQQAALESVLDQIGPGMTELEACALLEWELKTRGSEEPAFPPIVAARANGSKPHAVPGKTKLAANRPLLVDWGATVEGYRSDMTRTFTFGRWPKKIAEIYPIVEEAFHAGIAAVRPGVTGREVDRVARKVIEDAGFGPRFGHSLGHGIGLDVHELPRLSKQSEDVLKPGMIVTIEPGIYLPGIGGVRIENDVLVTERGRADLCSMPSEIGWATR